MSGFSFSAFQGGNHVKILRELGLTPGHMKALSLLDPDEPRPMRAMADSLACDASMVTWLVDRLEERGLVERKTSPADRRVKTLVLTPRGIRTRNRLLEALQTPPSELLELDMESLGSLRDQLAKLPNKHHSGWSHMGPPAPEPERSVPASVA